MKKLVLAVTLIALLGLSLAQEVTWQEMQDLRADYKAYRTNQQVAQPNYITDHENTVVFTEAEEMRQLKLEARYFRANPEQVIILTEEEEMRQLKLEARAFRANPENALILTEEQEMRELKILARAFRANQAHNQSLIANR